MKLGVSMHFGYAETEVGRELRCFGKTEL